MEPVIGAAWKAMPNVVQAAKRQFQFTGTAAQIEESLGQLEQSDLAAEEDVKKLSGESGKGCAIGFGGGCLLPMLIGAMVQNGVFDSLPVEVWKGFLLASFCLGPVGLIKYSSASARKTQRAKADVDNYRYQALRRLHRFLTPDSQESSYSYMLDLRLYDEKPFFVREDKFGSMFSLPAGSTKFFETPVLQARCKLNDGSVLRLSATRLTRVKAYKKRGRSGKVKYKSKVKFQDRFELQLKLPGEASAPTATAPPRQSLAGRPTIKVDGRKVVSRMKVKVGTKPFDVAPLLELCVWTFRQLNDPAN